MSDDKDGEQQDRQFVTSLARGLMILAAFGPDDRTLSNQELAERTGLPRPTVSRFTHTLRKLNYLAYHQRLGRYSLAPRVIELSQTAFAATGIRDIARPGMVTLSELADVSVALGVPSDLSVRYIELVRRPEAIVLNLDVGARLPLCQTAIGRAYLASLAPRPREALIARLQKADPALWDVQAPNVAAAVACFEARGYVTGFGQWRPELNAIATVIRSVEGADPLLLSVSGLSSVLTVERAEQEFAPLLLSTARSVEARMARLYHS
ncbi:IclR family transcriptional regulator [Tropicimonas sp. IMCC34043]|uniref:IclR family transcriptional regulator n=1 Tax=Tropicimonas sp. IMCC34043 TaxID=2248760 RepID=UPI0018E513BF|nr:IclR family transcriptional regulator [Tropicimonas sp. IMCC34043]